MNINRLAGWTLILGAFLLLALRGDLELLLILLPLSLLLALAAGQLGHRKTQADECMKKG